MFYKICGEKYEVIDTLEHITMADSFVKNKLGIGHGEAKLYIGNISSRLNDFFDDYDRECFLNAEDIREYLKDTKDEFYNPKQNYIQKDKMITRYEKAKWKLDQLDTDILKFRMYRVDVNPPRVYINSNSDYYNFMREIGLVNISYLSILKIRSNEDKIYYYYKIFIDYKADVGRYISPVEIEQTKVIEENLNISKQIRECLVKSRIGQGEYRLKLLQDCMATCPFTLVNDERLLIASHIKPWAKSNDCEKIDCKNGFIFTPTYDRLFDQGFITFNDNKLLCVSPWLSPMNQKRLGIYDGKKIEKLPIDNKRIVYLKYHREFEFKK